ncbi:hypothetical protein C5167_035552 [Papaver somniferum]|uniref:Uncharacterized protein n=1 Tax=Papaver somniferum TaxID=3469 RepID=A0A4Y7KJ70_PAPSO|nr:hypothetical protein C5167_035552 [Papaver somniferum]
MTKASQPTVVPKRSTALVYSLAMENTTTAKKKITALYSFPRQLQMEHRLYEVVYHRNHVSGGQLPSSASDTGCHAKMLIS